jgi:hypothetical protein
MPHRYIDENTSHLIKNFEGWLNESQSKVPFEEMLEFVETLRKALPSSRVGGKISSQTTPLPVIWFFFNQKGSRKTLTFEVRTYANEVSISETSPTYYTTVKRYDSTNYPRVMIDLLESKGENLSNLRGTASAKEYGV